eukprot:6190299-Pleurochrysis_carterae.AAC.4
MRRHKCFAASYGRVTHNRLCSFKDDAYMMNQNKEISHGRSNRENRPSWKRMDVTASSLRMDNLNCGLVTAIVMTRNCFTSSLSKIKEYESCPKC